MTTSDYRVPAEIWLRYAIQDLATADFASAEHKIDRLFESSAEPMTLRLLLARACARHALGRPAESANIADYVATLYSPQAIDAAVDFIRRSLRGLGGDDPVTRVFGTATTPWAEIAQRLRAGGGA